MPKKYNVIVGSHAYEMLLDHSDFLWQASPRAADRLELSFRKSLDRIAENPFQFPFADEIDFPNLPPDTFRKCLFESRYKALFRLDENEAHIIAVIDSRMENLNL